MARVQPGYPTPVLLFELVALVGIDKVVSEIGEKIEIVVEPVGHDLGGGIRRPVVPFTLQAITMRMATIVRVE